MKKKISLLIMCILSLFLSIDNIYAKQVIKLKECEYTEAFKRYMKLSDEEKAKTIMPMMCKITSSFSSSYKTTSSLGSITDSKFDLRTLGKVTSVKNQNPTGLCWTFATNSAIESNLLVNDYGEYDLSEAHIELALQNKFKTPYKTVNRYFNIGGNSWLSSSYLLNYWGPVAEKDMPFSIVKNLVETYASSYDTTGMDGKDIIVDVNNVEFLSATDESCGKNAASTKEMKKFLINNGALYVDYFHYEDEEWECDQSTKKCKRVSPYLNGPYYFYDGKASVDKDGVQEMNHAVSIVGWDDTISKDNFNEDKKPTQDGAWIVKNSWGTGFEESGYDAQYGDKGYYYISYEDINICKSVASFDADNKKSDNLYSYDYLNNPTMHLPLEDLDKAYVSAIYNKKTTNEEVIDKIILLDIGIKQSYKVYYLKGNLFGQSLSSAKLISEGSFNGENYGYRSIKLNDQIKIDDIFTVIVLYEKDPQSEKLAIPAAGKVIGDYLGSYEASSDSTYISEDGIKWVDTSTKNFNPVLKVYTNNVDDVTTTSTTKQTTTSTTKQTTTSTTKQTTTSKKEETTTSKTTTKKVETTTSKKEEITTSKTTTKKEEITTSKTTSDTTKKTTTKTTTKKQEEVELEIVPNEKNEESYIDTTPSNNTENKNDKESDEKNPSTLDINVFGIVSLILVLGALIPISIKKIIKK